MSTKKKTIAVSGGFDPVHIGHVRMIQGAAEQGDVWVIINSDPWLMRKKGYVFMPWEERAEIMAALKGVTKISHANDDDGTVCEALERLQPDAFANGGDRKTNNTPEMDVCERLGIEMLWNVGGGKIQSSSELVAKSLEDQMSLLERCQKRFERATEKEHWERLKTLLFSEDKESVVQGMSLIEQLNEEVYYDGVCTFLDDDGKGNWWLSTELDCENDLALKVEILRMAEENVGHDIKEAFKKGCLDEMFVGVCGEIEVSELSDSQRERLLSKVSEMVEIKGGTFMMGSPEDEGDREDDEVQFEVTLTRDFLMMKYAVTQVLWESVMGENPSKFKGASRPVEKVSWFDCIDFANQLSEREGFEKVYERNGSEVKMNLEANGYRLPTEAEWEYTARGGENCIYSGSNNVDEVAWYSDNSGSKTHPVGQKKANGFGLYDMSGNVCEWVWDWYGEYPRTLQTDTLGNPNGSYRVYRGGDWSCDPHALRGAFRGFDGPAAREDCLGFRLGRSP